jgi:hypothetical protein
MTCRASVAAASFERCPYERSVMEMEACPRNFWSCSSRPPDSKKSRE